jgi:energy-coupling factor transporter ATP-binding protein EcfA2
MRPAVLILDEPMGGLDPAGRQEVLAALSRLRSQEREQPVTIVMTESDPEAVATFADRLAVLGRPSPQALEGTARLPPTSSGGGQIALEGPPGVLFHQVDRLASLGVAIPQMARLAATLNRRLGTTFDFLTVAEAQDALAVHLG